MKWGELAAAREDRWRNIAFALINPIGRGFDCKC
jgi:hypothetical protein